jgi:hypothetical protein
MTGGAALPIARGAQMANVAKNTALGAGTGYAFDVGANLKEGQRGAGTFKPGVGTALGAAFAPATATLGAVNRMASKGAGNGATKSAASFVDDFVSPKQTNNVKAEAIKRGQFNSPGIFKSAQITPSPRDSRLADSVRDVVSPKASLIQNVNAINSKISFTNNGVKSYVAENKVPFNTNQLKTKLMSAKEDSKLIFASDATAEKTYDAVVDEFLKHVAKKDTAGLLASRQPCLGRECEKVHSIRRATCGKRVHS